MIRSPGLTPASADKAIPPGDMSIATQSNSFRSDRMKRPVRRTFTSDAAAVRGSLAQRCSMPQRPIRWLLEFSDAGIPITE